MHGEIGGILLETAGWGRDPELSGVCVSSAVFAGAAIGAVLGAVD